MEPTKIDYSTMNYDEISPPAEKLLLDKAKENNISTMESENGLDVREGLLIIDVLGAHREEIDLLVDAEG